MYINAYIPFKVRIIVYCELSHEHFMNLINFFHNLKFETQITDGGEWNYYAEVDDKFSTSLWADDETIEEVYATIKKIINAL